MIFSLTQHWMSHFIIAFSLLDKSPSQKVVLWQLLSLQESLGCILPWWFWMSMSSAGLFVSILRPLINKFRQDTTGWSMRTSTLSAGSLGKNWKALRFNQLLRYICNLWDHWNEKHGLLPENAITEIQVKFKSTWETTRNLFFENSWHVTFNVSSNPFYFCDMRLHDRKRFCKNKPIFVKWEIINEFGWSTVGLNDQSERTGWKKTRAWWHQSLQS